MIPHSVKENDIPNIVNNLLIPSCCKSRTIIRTGDDVSIRVPYPSMHEDIGIEFSPFLDLDRDIKAYLWSPPIDSKEESLDTEVMCLGVLHLGIRYTTLNEHEMERFIGRIPDFAQITKEYGKEWIQDLLDYPPIKGIGISKAFIYQERGNEEVKKWFNENEASFIKPEHYKGITKYEIFFLMTRLYHKPRFSLEDYEKHGLDMVKSIALLELELPFSCKYTQRIIYETRNNIMLISDPKHFLLFRETLRNFDEKEEKKSIEKIMKDFSITSEERVLDLASYISLPPSKEVERITKTELMIEYKKNSREGIHKLLSKYNDLQLETYLDPEIKERGGFLSSTRRESITELVGYLSKFGAVKTSLEELLLPSSDKESFEDIFGSDIKDLVGCPSISIGSDLDGYVYYSIDEITEMINTGYSSGKYRIVNPKTGEPQSTKYWVSSHVWLIKISSCIDPTIESNIISLPGISLREALERVASIVSINEKSDSKSIDLISDYCKISTSNIDLVELMIMSLFRISMYLRRWDGKGQYPILKKNTGISPDDIIDEEEKNQISNLIDSRVAPEYLIYKECVNKLPNDIKEAWEGLPLLKNYGSNENSEGTNGEIELHSSGTTISSTIREIFTGDICIRIISGSLAITTGAYYMTILGKSIQGFNVNVSIGWIG